ncbi:MAG: hypothetical protein ABJH68_20390 [Ilumatobacter sp.]|uniref:hypothetical protein n=1 Tax=Ilumatobacter sp. TaxID=1967498 RepID=UPI0032999627
MKQPRASAGSVIVQANLAGTTLFVLSAVVAAVTYGGTARAVAAAVALVLFFAGIAAFAWSFWNAVQRSRTEMVAVTQLYLLLGDAIPASVRRPMLAALAVQFVVGLATAVGRANAPDGSPGTSLALGVLVPLFGFGLNGLWAAFHGEYREREDPLRQE